MKTLHHTELKAIKPKELLEMVGTMIQSKTEPLLMMGDGGRDKGGIQLFKVKCLECGNITKKQKGSLANGSGCGCRSGATRLNQQLVGTKVMDHNRNFEILDYLKKEVVDGKVLQPRYNIKCLDCDREFEMQGGHLRNGQGCGCRSGAGVGATRLNQQLVGTKVIEHNRNFEILDYLKKEKKDGKTLMSRYSIRCLDCSRVFEMRVGDFNQGIGCTCRTLSKPESLLKTLLDGANINYIHDQSFTWSENKRYDFFLPDMNAIIELHGGQHYEDNSYFQTTADEQKSNDIFKRITAQVNGIDHYFEVDCRETTDEYIVNSLVNTLPPELIQKLL